MLKALLKSNPGLEVTPQILLGFVAEKTKKQAPPRSPLLDDDLDLSASRGRSGDRDPHFSNRSYSSDDSTGNSSHINSRRSSLGPRGPQTPQTLNKSTSVFDTERRQRSTPLTAPSSWGNRRPAPKRRRKSDAGNPSDSEVSTKTSLLSLFARAGDVLKNAGSDFDSLAIYRWLAPAEFP